MAKQAKRHMGLEVQGDLVTSNSLMFRNRIINGDMRIDQRNSGAAVTITNTGTTTYLVDRFYGYGTVASKFSAQRNAGAITPPAGFTNYLGTTSLSTYSVTANNEFSLGQHIEGFNVADLGWGTATAQSITISFWARSSLTGTFGGSIRNGAINRSYAFSYTITSANTWEQKTITIPGDTSGTWLTDANIGLRLNWSLGVGSSLSTTAGSWQAGSFISATGAQSVVGTNGATFYLTGVQLEVGSKASAFERRPFGMELQLCQRYYQYIDRRNTASYFWCGVGPTIVTMRAGSSCVIDQVRDLGSGNLISSNVSATGETPYDLGYIATNFSNTVSLYGIRASAEL